MQSPLWLLCGLLPTYTLDIVTYVLRNVAGPARQASHPRLSGAAAGETLVEEFFSSGHTQVRSSTDYTDAESEPAAATGVKTHTLLHRGSLLAFRTCTRQSACCGRKCYSPLTDA